MRGIAVRKTMATHQHKIWGGLLLTACIGWGATYIDLLEAEKSAKYSHQWWTASQVALHYTNENAKGSVSESYSEARGIMLSQARSNPEGAFILLQAAEMAGDVTLHQQLIKEVANVSTQGRMATIGDWLLGELEEASGAVRVSAQTDGLLTQEQRSKLVECINRAKEGKLNQSMFLAQRYGIPDMTGQAACNL